MTPAPHPHTDCLMKEHWGELRQWKVNSEQREESLERKLVEMQADFNSKISEMREEFKERLDLILLQTTRTNGRVIALEKWRVGLMAGISVLALVLGPDAVSRIVQFFAAR